MAKKAKKQRHCAKKKICDLRAPPLQRANGRAFSGLIKSNVNVKRRARACEPEGTASRSIAPLLLTIKSSATEHGTIGPKYCTPPAIGDVHSIGPGIQGFQEMGISHASLTHWT